jgi:hypothetical protein
MAGADEDAGNVAPTLRIMISTDNHLVRPTLPFMLTEQLLVI